MASTRRPLSVNLRMTGFVAGLAAVMLGPGCFVDVTNLNFCSNINGNTFCEQRYGDQLPYCLFGSDPCVAGLPAYQRDNPGFDGCVANQPEDECYSPCGGGQAKDDLESCVGVGVTGPDEETTTSSGVGTESTASTGSIDGTGSTESTGSTTSDETSSTTETTTGPTTDCGNGVLEVGEECDGAELDGADCISVGFDGGVLGCTNDCMFDTSECMRCTNGVREGTELCDGEDFGGLTCASLGFNGGELACSVACMQIDTSECEAPGPVSVCGDDVREGMELCDGEDFGDLTCVSLGFTGGVLGCDACTMLETSGCEAPILTSECGNGVLEDTELCDEDAFGGMSCVTLGFTGGALACDATCMQLDASGCEAPDPVYVCGNGTREGAELCDEDDFGGLDCMALGFVGGALSCSDSCTLDASGCEAPDPVGTCDNGMREGAELCDGDDLGGLDCIALGFIGGGLSCDASCMLNASGCEAPEPVYVCGNGIREGAELCDVVAFGGLDCMALGFVGGALSCSDSCTLDASGCEAPDPVGSCGNGMREGAELCDGDAFGGLTCASLGFSGGVLGCGGSCMQIDTSECEPTSVCGNGILEMGEECDENELNDSDCLTEGFGDGVLGCTVSCILDTSECMSCGNSEREGTEPCDGDAFDGLTCVSLGFNGGLLGCNASCTEIDVSGCYGCGDGLIGPGEVCDGTNLAGQDCSDHGYSSPGGTLACALGCTAYDTSSCSICGDSIRDLDEVCDGGDLGGATCVSRGYPQGGTLACAPGCASYDTSNCVPCGNNEIDPGETCDGSSLGGATCVSRGYTQGGTLMCTLDCTAYDTSSCVPCGNGEIDPGEACDGSNLGDATCVTQGYMQGGMLACAADCTAYDTSSCVL